MIGPIVLGFLLAGATPTARASSRNSLSDVTGNDARLTKAVTIRRAVVTLPDLLRELSDATGVSLKSGRRPVELKVTIYAANRPLAEIMRGLTSVFDMRWTRAGLPERPEYTLEPDAPRWSAIERLRSTRRGRIRSATQSRIDVARRAAGNHDFTALDDKRSALETERDRLLIDLPDGWQSRLAQIDARFVTLPPLPDYLIGLRLNQMPAARVEAFWKGARFTFDLMDEPPPRLAAWLQRANPQHAEESGPTILDFRFDPDSGLLFSLFDGNRRLAHSSGIAENATDEAVTDTGLPARADVETRLAADQTLGVKVPSEGATRVFLTRWDELAWLSDRSGFAFVAEALRTMAYDPGVAQANESRSLADWLMRHTHSYDIRRDGHLLLFKLRDPTRRSDEFHEVSIARLEHLTASQGGPGFEDWAAFAFDLNVADRARIDQRAPMSTADIRSSLSAGGAALLSLWHTLSAEERQAANSADGLPYGAMGRGQQLLFWEAIGGIQSYPFPKTDDPLTSEAALNVADEPYVTYAAIDQDGRELSRGVRADVEAQIAAMPSPEAYSVRQIRTHAVTFTLTVAPSSVYRWSRMFTTYRKP